MPPTKTRIPNVALKVAILQSGQTQREIGWAASISETRLSDIVRGYVLATAIERKALAKTLRRPIDVLFPDGVR
jgi:hypothetical protein